MLRLLPICPRTCGEGSGEGVSAMAGTAVMAAASAKVAAIPRLRIRKTPFRSLECDSVRCDANATRKRPLALPLQTTRKDPAALEELRAGWKNPLFPLRRVQAASADSTAQPLRLGSDMHSCRRPNVSFWLSSFCSWLLSLQPSWLLFWQEPFCQPSSRPF